MVPFNPMGHACFMRCFAALALAGLTLAACGGGEKPSKGLPAAPDTITITSDFADGATLPKRYTCKGAGTKPPLTWSGVPAGARELVLVVEDPDAEHFVHWTVLGMKPAQTRVPAGATETENSFGKRGWGAACPPNGDDPHHYVFALYAVDAPLGLGADASPDEVRSALEQHALARGELVGLFAT